MPFSRWTRFVVLCSCRYRSSVSQVSALGRHNLCRHSIYKSFLDDLDIDTKECLAYLSLSLAVHKSHMLSDATSSQRATALKSLAQGGQPAAAAMWCTATPSQQSTSSPAAESIIPHPWILHPPPQCPHIHDPWPFISDPSSLQDPGVCQNWTGLYGTLYRTVWQLSCPIGG